MARPDQIAVVTANGQRYDIWTEIECTRSAEDIIDHALLTVAEISPRQRGVISGLKLQPGDQATVTLAGQKIISGLVYMRQGAVDANAHQVQIGISSMGQAVMASTVDGEPGQYINQTLQQIGSAVFGKVGVKFSVSASGDMPFPRVSEHIGESRFSFIERLCRMRNMHMIDDGTGGIVAFRGAAKGGLVLREGQNIERGRILLKNNDHVDEITVKGHDANNDSADANRSPTGSTKVSPPVNRPFKIIAEEMGNSAAMQLRANHQGDWTKYMQVDGEIVTPGWLCPQGDLWWNHVTAQVTIVSPSLLPEDTFQFMIKGVVHRQSNHSGTTTSVMLCRADGFGSGIGESLQFS
ncbi:phage baseplate assembly protein [Bradyrhizobium japonicum]|uniref:phage baseplate assembly protein n=1 Tax=Bradyrhizobium japonicum TaxID=375 RepID=UPI00041143FF